MKRTLIALALGLGLGFAGPASAAEITAGTLSIKQPWTRVTPPGAKVAGGFMTITNTGKETDRLIGGSALISGRLEVHEMSMDGGVMKMREVAGGLEIKPGETVVLKPGSYHVMFMELKEGLEAGKPVKGTLVFEKAGTVEVSYEVAPLGAKSPDDKTGGAMEKGTMQKGTGGHGGHH